MAHPHYDIELEIGDGISVSDRLKGGGCTITFARDALVYLTAEHEAGLRNILNQRHEVRLSDALPLGFDTGRVVGRIGPRPTLSPETAAPIHADNVMSLVQALQPEGVAR